MLITIFPLSSSPIRTLPVKILNEIINSLTDNYNIDVCLDNNSEISNFIYNNINLKNISIVDPRDVKHLFSLIKNIEYGLFMDSGPLHVAKMFNKRGILLETSVSSDILLNNYSLIKGIKNKFSSNFCKAPCGLTDIFNFNNNFGCYDSLEIESNKFHSNNFKNMTSRGVKSNYLKKVLKPVACVTSLNVQAILNALKKDLSL